MRFEKNPAADGSVTRRLKGEAFSHSTSQLAVWRSVLTVEKDIVQKLRNVT